MVTEAFFEHKRFGKCIQRLTTVQLHVFIRSVVIWDFGLHVGQQFSFPCEITR